ncbi:hypothetical protein ACFCXP_21720 [Streptomyces niveus]|uniref:hypothetical protein n=1 Tax=Streptomyces niveus TaxID=193462 RepID=UPI0035DEC02B
MDLLGAVAAILPGFSTVAELGGVAPPVRLSRGPATRRLVYVPSPMALGGAHQYARFAARCRCPSILSWTFSSRGRQRRPATRPSSCWTPICRTTAGATTTCGVRCSRECRISAPRLAAMSRYGELILDRSPGAFTAPVLLVRPADSFVREMPGNDFTLLEEWLAAPPGGGSAAGT